MLSRLPRCVILAYIAWKRKTNHMDEHLILCQLSIIELKRTGLICLTVYSCFQGQSI
jgi:hypothetical protein